MIEFSTVSADGTTLAGRHWPVKAPKAVMALVHGFGEHCGRYDHMASFLNTHAIAVVALDFHGHGKTDGPRGVVKSYDDFRNDLAALLKSAQGFYPDTPQILYGHSMGGGIVLDHGLRDQSSLPIIASAPFIKLAEPVPKVVRAAAKIIGKFAPKGTIKQPIDGTKISNLGEEQMAYLNDPLNHGTLGLRLAEAMISSGETIAETASNWNRPLLLLHSKADQLTAYEGSAAFAEAAQQVDFHSYETSQHEMHNDAPRDAVYALMVDFILKQSGPKSV